MWLPKASTGPPILTYSLRKGGSGLKPYLSFQFCKGFIAMLEELDLSLTHLAWLVQACCG